MASESAPLSSLTSLGQTPSPGDLLYVVDVSDTTEGADGTSKSVTYNHISSGGGGGQPASTTTVWFSQVLVNNVSGSVEIVAGTKYWIELMIPFDITATGIAWEPTGYGNTENDPAEIIVELHDTNGVLVANSSLSGTTVPYNTNPSSFYKVPFTSPYAASAGRYFVVLQFNVNYSPDTLDLKFAADGLQAAPYIAGSATGSFGSGGNITPGTSYTIQVGALCSTY